MNQLARFDQLGAQISADSTLFRVYSGVAQAIELCLFDEAGAETARHALMQATNDTWSIELPDIQQGQRYGYRVHGPYDPQHGHRCNPHKLLIDPYARKLDGEVQWQPALAGFGNDDPHGDQLCTIDSAPFIPKSVVVAEHESLSKRDLSHWRNSVVYELNVRGFTMRWPDLSDAERGRFAGLSNGAVLEYLKALGITTVELMPVHAFMDEQFLTERGLRNYWGYNSINFFAPMPRYAGADPVAEFRTLTTALHEAGLEVVLDVVYNHTAETDELGPTLSLRGFDNAAYYRLQPDNPARYINDTGCGNTLNADAPVVWQLVLDSLIYWHKIMGIDGFRFDLAPVLGRHANGFSASHPLLGAIETHAELAHARLIAEPWDPGPGGYQLGQFGARWAEWNDRYRDDVRRFWQGAHNASGDFARVIHGSADLFAHKGLDDHASVNFVTCHDGFTLADLVSYAERHNEANLEDNQDGHAHNLSHNHGHEGPTDNRTILASRRKQRLNLLATLLTSRGVPMLLAGDELGHSQQGNNNAYAQDNEIAWLDWSLLDNDPEFLSEVRGWIALRKAEPLLNTAGHAHGEPTAAGLPDIEWLAANGKPLTDAAWSGADAFALVLTAASAAGSFTRLAIAFNRAGSSCRFALPAHAASWQLVRATGAATLTDGAVELDAGSLAALKLDTRSG